MERNEARERTRYGGQEEGTAVQGEAGTVTSGL